MGRHRLKDMPDFFHAPVMISKVETFALRERILDARPRCNGDDSLWAELGFYLTLLDMHPDAGELHHIDYRVWQIENVILWRQREVANL